MNMNMLINMFTRMIARRAMNWGINKGIDTLAGKGDAPETTGRQRPNRQTQDLAKRMKTLNRMTRR